MAWEEEVKAKLISSTGLFAHLQGESPMSDFSSAAALRDVRIVLTQRFIL
jgi:hypothetical protein